MGWPHPQDTHRQRVASAHAHRPCRRLLNWPAHVHTHRVTGCGPAGLAHAVDSLALPRRTVCPHTETARMHSQTEPCLGTRLGCMLLSTHRQLARLCGGAVAYSMVQLPAHTASGAGPAAVGGAAQNAANTAAAVSNRSRRQPLARRAMPAVDVVGVAAGWRRSWLAPRCPCPARLGLSRPRAGVCTSPRGQPPSHRRANTHTQWCAGTCWSRTKQDFPHRVVLKWQPSARLVLGSKPL